MEFIDALKVFQTKLKAYYGHNDPLVKVCIPRDLYNRVSCELAASGLYRFESPQDEHGIKILGIKLVPPDER